MQIITSLLGIANVKIDVPHGYAREPMILQCFQVSA